MKRPATGIVASEIVATTILLLASCAVANDIPDRPIPADAVQIRVYTDGGRGGDGFPETVRWNFQSVGAVGQWGVITHIREATCIVVGSRWTLSIDDNGHEVPIDPSRHFQFSGASPMDLMIVRDQAGKINVTEGLPGWMDGKPLGCAPLPEH